MKSPSILELKCFLFRDCFPPGNTVALRDESRYEICRYAMGEELLPLLATAGSTRADIWKSFLGNS